MITREEAEAMAERLKKPALTHGLEEWDPTFDLRQDAAAALRSLVEEREALQRMAAHASAFRQDGGITIEKRGLGKWAIVRDGFVLNRAYTWEWEPLPSGRDEDFIARTRFDLDDAFARSSAALKAPTHG